jgi:hypothetical protein
MAYVVGLDLGQVHDHSALMVIEQRSDTTPPAYDVRFLFRWALGSSYPAIERAVARLLHRPPLVGNATLLVDYTGVGRPIVDELRQIGLDLQAITIHGGDAVTHTGANWRTPKRDLVGAVQLLLQQRRLQIAESLPLTPVLTQELATFRVRIDQATAHDSYSAWRERDHDDLVLATALACWWSIRVLGDKVPEVDLRRSLQGTTQPSVEQRSRHSRGAIPRHIMRAAARSYGLEEQASYSEQGPAWEEQKRELYAEQCAAADARDKAAAAARREAGGFQGAM